MLSVAIFIFDLVVFFIAIFNNNGILKKKSGRSCPHGKTSQMCQNFLLGSPSHSLSTISLFTMGNHRISDDLKEAALRLQDDGHSTAYIK